MAETRGETLMRMFPNIDPSVVNMILENVNDDLTAASELLLEMSEVPPEQEFPALGGVQPLNIDEFPSMEVAWGSLRPPASKPVPRVSPKSSTTSPSLTSIGNKISSNPQLADCLQELESDNNVLVVMRGLPGSGKTTLSRRLITLAHCGVILSSDDYFYDSRGQYKFRPELLSEAHTFNLKRASEAVKEKKKLIIIDNTNTCAWEMRPYIELGINNFYKVKILEPDTEWKFKPRLLAQKNRHDVPKQKIEIMLDRYEKDLTVENLLNLWKLKLPPAPEPRNSEAVPDVEVASISGDETYQSISDDNDEGDKDNTETYAHQSELNPEVEEFKPLIEEPLSAQEEPEEIDSLLSLFPHLSVEEVSQMYNNKTIKMALDPQFALTLQEHFGELAPPEYLGKLPQEQILSLDISLNIAKVLFTLWQQSILAKLNDETVLVTNSDSSQLPRPPRPVEEATPAKTVLAPNAVAYYENQMFSRAVEESKTSLGVRETRKKPKIVIKENQVDKESNEGVSESNLDQLIEQRNSLYKKAMDANGQHMQGIRSYYSAQARELNAVIKASQKETQMEMFIDANKSCPSTRLDLHYLQTGDAVKQLSTFISQWEKVITEGKKSSLNVEIVTGRGNRSDQGKSRLRPAVTNWLAQKNYHFSDVNEGMGV